ncbi:hypothetical protein [Acetobacter garciniae]|nr:hypothetical protein [Acetobacter garciniae]
MRHFSPMARVTLVLRGAMRGAAGMRRIGGRGLADICPGRFSTA